MQYPTAKKSLKKQVRPVLKTKLLKNHDRILYVNGLFTPPKLAISTIVKSERHSSFSLAEITGLSSVFGGVKRPLMYRIRS